MQTSEAERGGDLNRSIRKMPAEELSVDLVPLESSTQGWSEGKNFRAGSPSYRSPEELEVARHLKLAAEALQAASRAATAAGYGDQFRASLGETFAALTHTRGLLS